MSESVVTAEPKKKETMSCPHCDKEYSSKPGLSYHLQKCTKREEKKEEKVEQKEKAEEEKIEKDEEKETDKEEQKEKADEPKAVSSDCCPHCKQEYKTKSGMTRHIQKCPKRPVKVVTPPVSLPLSRPVSVPVVDIPSLQRSLREAQFKERELSIQNDILTSENKRIKESLYERDKQIYELQKELNKLRENNYDILYPRMEERNKRLTEENYKIKREIENLKHENDDLRDESRRDKKMFTDMVTNSIAKSENGGNQVIHRNIENTRNNNYTIQIFDPELSRRLQYDPIAGCNEVRDIINKIMAQAGLCYQTGMGFGEDMNMEEMGNSISQLMNSIFNNNGDEDEEPRDMTGVSGEVESSVKKYGYRFV